MSEAAPPRLHATFLASAPSLDRCPPPDAPEVAFAGRSNAGKSSVLNRLTGTRQLARVSRTPGRTQLLNFFEVTGAVGGGGRLVDLPGYGYAKAQRQAQLGWQAAVNDYLSQRETLRAVVLVSDIRHPGQPFDTQLLEWAAESQLPLLWLLNKADKLKRGAQQSALRDGRRAVAGARNVQVMLFSARTGQGQAQAVAYVRQALSGTGDD